MCYYSFRNWILDYYVALAISERGNMLDWNGQNQQSSHWGMNSI